MQINPQNVRYRISRPLLSYYLPKKQNLFPTFHHQNCVHLQRDTISVPRYVTCSGSPYGNITCIADRFGVNTLTLFEACNSIKWCYIMVYINSVRTSQETHYVSATKPSRLMLFRERVAVYCENHTEHTNTLCGQKPESGFRVTLRLAVYR
jgi:hypothetical protein